MNATDMIRPVRHGILLSLLALILGIAWAGYLATAHERIHGNFEQQESSATPHAVNSQALPLTAALVPQAWAHGDAPAAHADNAGDTHHASGQKHQHSHSGSLATDAMQRLLRGHIHWMGLGTLSTVLLLVVAFTTLKPCWKNLLGWTFGLGALLYPPAWILMGFRTVTLGPDVAETSVAWLFVPAAGLLLASLVAVFCILVVELFGLQQRIPLGARLFMDASS